MIITATPEIYLDPESIDYDDKGEVLSGVVMGHTWSEVMNYHLKKNPKNTTFAETIQALDKTKSKVYKEINKSID